MSELMPNHPQHGTPEQWRDFWWNERAKALNQIAPLQRYADYCSQQLTPNDRGTEHG